jgi:hypothetical protein
MNGTTSADRITYRLADCGRRKADRGQRLGNVRSPVDLRRVGKRLARSISPVDDVADESLGVHLLRPLGGGGNSLLLAWQTSRSII